MHKTHKCSKENISHTQHLYFDFCSFPGQRRQGPLRLQEGRHGGAVLRHHLLGPRRGGRKSGRIGRSGLSGGRTASAPYEGEGGKALRTEEDLQSGECLRIQIHQWRQEKLERRSD